MKSIHLLVLSKSDPDSLRVRFLQDNIVSLRIEGPTHREGSDGVGLEACLVLSFSGFRVIFAITWIIINLAFCAKALSLASRRSIRLAPAVTVA